MKSNGRNKQVKKSKFPIIIGVIWGFMVALFIGFTIDIYSYSEEYYKHAPTMVRYLGMEDYGRFCQNMNLQIEGGLTAEKEPLFTELLGIYDYLLAATQVDFYETMRNPEKVEYYSAQKDEALVRMGQFTYLQDKLDEYVES